jgi:hypothetical protein
VSYRELSFLCYRILIKKPERKRPPGKCRHRWEAKVIMDFREVGHEDVDLINLFKIWSSGGLL